MSARIKVLIVAGFSKGETRWIRMFNANSGFSWHEGEEGALEFNNRADAETAIRIRNSRNPKSNEFEFVVVDSVESLTELAEHGIV